MPLSSRWSVATFVPTLIRSSLAASAVGCIDPERRQSQGDPILCLLHVIRVRFMFVDVKPVRSGGAVLCKRALLIQ